MTETGGVPKTPPRSENETHEVVSSGNKNFIAIFNQVKGMSGSDFRGFDLAAWFISAEYRKLQQEDREKIFAAVRKTQDDENHRKNESSEILYFPGPIHIVEALITRFQFKTIPEIGTDRESVYFFNGQIFERADEKIKAEAHREYLKQWNEMLISAETNEDKSLSATLRYKLNRGPSVNDINEVLAMIRRTTFTQDEMNPSSHIPFLNGLLNLETRKMEPFKPDLFYTFQINANFLYSYVTLQDTPLFSYLLNTVFYARDLPLVLSYYAYTIYPDLPVHKTLFVVGPPRIGKGTNARVLQGLMPKGSGSVSLARLLTAERFAFTGIEGKNLLIDSETKRKFKRGTILDWSAFCNLFGKDVLSIEPKGHEAHDQVSKAKGIFLLNLPSIPIDSPPAILRILLVVTRDDIPIKVIPNLDLNILKSERDQIATMLAQILFKLIDRNFVFPGQLSGDETAQLIEKLADPVQNFIDEETDYDKQNAVLVDDAYSRFMGWCKDKGIPVIARQTFVKKFGHAYPKKRIGSHGKGGYVFTSCLLYVEDLKGNVNTKNQVGTLPIFTENLKTSDSKNNDDKFQHASHIPTHYEKEDDHVRIVKDEGHKLEPIMKGSGSPENKAAEEILNGSNLYKGGDQSKDEINRKLHTNPSNSNVQVKNDKTDINDHLGYLIRVCTQNPGPLNPFLKLRKGITFRIHKDEIAEFKYYEFSREPEKGEVLDNDVHFIETFKAAEIPDRQKRVKQLLILVLNERPDESVINIQRRLSDLEPELTIAEIDTALKELLALDLIHKSEDSHYG